MLFSEGDSSLAAPSPSVNFNNNIYCTASLSCSPHCMSSNFDAYSGGNGERGGSLSIGTQSYRSSSNLNRSISIKHKRYHHSALLSSCSLDTSKITQASIANRFRCLCESCHVVVRIFFFKYFFSKLFQKGT